MTKILNLKSNLGIISIELLDTEFVDFWIKHFQNVMTNYKLHTQIGYQPTLRIRDRTVKKLVNDILLAIDQVNNLEYVTHFPESFNEEQLSKLDLNTQQALNILHRYCVVGTELRNRWLYDENPTFEFIDYGNDQFSYALNLLNQNIHALEHYVSTPNKVKFKNSIMNAHLNLVEASKYNNVTVYQDSIDVEIPNSMQKYLRLTGYDVWIKKDILGKDFITAFSEHEDPTQFDIRPPPMISGGLLIDLNNGRDKLFNSAEFSDWLGSTPTDLQGSYPIGNIISGKNNLYTKSEVDFVGLREI